MSSSGDGDYIKTTSSNGDETEESNELYKPLSPSFIPTLQINTPQTSVSHFTTPTSTVNYETSLTPSSVESSRIVSKSFEADESSDTDTNPILLRVSNSNDLFLLTEGERTSVSSCVERSSFLEVIVPEHSMIIPVADHTRITEKPPTVRYSASMYPELIKYPVIEPVISPASSPTSAPDEEQDLSETSDSDCSTSSTATQPRSHLTDISGISSDYSPTSSITYCADVSGSSASCTITPTKYDSPESPATSLIQTPSKLRLPRIRTEPSIGYSATSPARNPSRPCTPSVNKPSTSGHSPTSATASPPRVKSSPASDYSTSPSPSQSTNPAAADVKDSCRVIYSVFRVTTPRRGRARAQPRGKISPNSRPDPLPSTSQSTSSTSAENWREHSFPHFDNSDKSVSYRGYSFSQVRTQARGSFRNRGAIPKTYANFAVQSSRSSEHSRRNVYLPPSLRRTAPEARAPRDEENVTHGEEAIRDAGPEDKRGYF